MKSFYRWMLLRPLDAVLVTRPQLALCDTGELRVAALLLLIAIFNAVDLAYTLFAHRIGWLHEMNPVAETFLSQGLEPSLICYKLLMVLAGTTMLWKLRRSNWAVPACWLLVAVNCLLIFLWYLWGREVIWAFGPPMGW